MIHTRVWCVAHLCVYTHKHAFGQTGLVRARWREHVYVCACDALGGCLRTNADGSVHNFICPERPTSGHKSVHHLMPQESNHQCIVSYAQRDPPAAMAALSRRRCSSTAVMVLASFDSA